MEEKKKAKPEKIKKPKKQKNEKVKKEKTKKVKNENKDIQAKSKDTKMKFKYKHPKLAIAIKVLIIVMLISCVIGAGIVIGLIYGLWGNDLKIDMSELVLTENSIIVDTDGNILAELTGDENRKIITLEEMSPYLKKAYVAIEDERYEKHHGVDLKRTAAAIISFVTHGGKSTAGGGSTITQQLVKNITQDKESRGIEGILRKVKEWAKAYQVEEVMSKDQILELYLNLIFIGGKQDNRGVEIGAEYYFNKSAKDLSIAECAFLAGINHSPNRYNPYNQTDVTEKVSKRTKTVLGQMKKLNYINQEEYDAAIAEVDAGFAFENGAKGNVYSSHTDALISQLIEQIMEEKQISENAAKTYLYSSGLKIYSTQVSSIQNVMEEEAKDKKYVLKSKTEKDENGNPVLAQGAVVVIEPTTGNVVGCIGQLGEKNTSRGQNRATQSLRQTGSSFKPLATLIPGIEEGVTTPATIYADSYTIFNKGTIHEYDPKNYNDYTGNKTVRSAVTTSQNIPFIKIMAELGNAKCVEYLKKMGITSLDDAKDTGLALSIGGLTYGVSPLEMAAAYAMIANDGVYIEPTFYSKAEDADGKIVLEPAQRTEKVCSEETAYIVKDLLKSVVKDAGGTAAYCAIKGIDVGAKTGTTNDDKDRWLCGFTNYYACAAWYGFDQPEFVYSSGRNPAGNLFDNIMTEIHKGLDASTFKKPENVISARICTDSGRLATEKCTHTYTEIFVKGKLPETCDGHQGEYTVCLESGKLANEYCTSKETRYTNYVVEKERLGIWDTPSVKTAGATAPTESCTIHVQPIVTPEEPKEPTEEPEQKPEDETPEEKPEQKPDDEKPEEKPSEGENKPSGPDKPNQGESGNTPESVNPTDGNITGEENNKPQT